MRHCVVGLWVLADDRFRFPTVLLAWERFYERSMARVPSALCMWSLFYNGGKCRIYESLRIGWCTFRCVWMGHMHIVILIQCINTSRPRQNGRHFADDIFKCIFLNHENVWIPIKISMKFVPKGPINNIPALVLIMAWRRPGDKPLSEPMIVSLPTHKCVTRPQWVN